MPDTRLGTRQSRSVKVKGTVALMDKETPLRRTAWPVPVTEVGTCGAGNIGYLENRNTKATKEKWK